MENKTYLNEKLNEVLVNEISVEEIESLEETVTPGFGFACGNDCFGFGCW